MSEYKFKGVVYYRLENGKKIIDPLPDFVIHHIQWDEELQDFVEVD